MRKFLTRLLQDRSGVSMAEFALIVPVLFVLAIGVIEAGRLILLTQKLQSGSFILADLAARDKTLSEEQLAGSETDEATGLNAVMARTQGHRVFFS